MGKKQLYIAPPAEVCDKVMMFKKCRSCGYIWESREAFLSDPAIEVTGYQVFFENLRHGLFLFNHSCKTTLSIEAEHLLDLYKGDFHSGRQPAAERTCPGRCLNENILSPCSDKCRCAFVSELLETLRQWKKNAM